MFRAIYFSLVIFVTGTVFLDGGSVCAAQESKAMTILAMGDSTTAGTPAFSSPVESPPDGIGDPESQYAFWVMKKHPDWIVLNRGVNGERSDEILERFKSDLKLFKPDVVVVLAGVNDLYQGRDTEQIKDNLKAIYGLAAVKKIKIMTCTVLPYDSSSVNVKNRMAELNGWIRAYSAEKGFMFCDTYLSVCDPQSDGRLAGSPDGLHPDVNGYRKMGEAITEVLEKEIS